MNGFLRSTTLFRLVLLIALCCVANSGFVFAQSPGERIRQLRDFFSRNREDSAGAKKGVQQAAGIPQDSNSSVQPASVEFSLSDQSMQEADVRNADSVAPTLPSGTREPDVGFRMDDPWDLARRLGVADNRSYPIPPDLRHTNLSTQSEADAFAKSSGCIACHTDVGNMHSSDTVRIGCTDCHGGDASTADIKRAHVMPRYPNAWRDSANPVSQLHAVES